MTDKDLQAIRARVEAASPGPWTVAEDIEAGGCVLDATGRNICTAGLDGGAPGPRRDEDQTFIATARTDVPALLAEVERLKAALQTARGALADIAGLSPSEIARGVGQRKAQRIYDDTAP